MSIGSDLLLTKLKNAGTKFVEAWLSASRRVSAAYRPPRGLVFYHKAYRYPENPVFDPYRADKILGYCFREGCFGSSHVKRPRDVGINQLAEVHEYDYLETIAAPETLIRVFGRDILSINADEVINVQRRMVAGTVEAARFALKRPRGARFMINLGGGFHHASHDGGGGFCLFNDVAVAIKTLRKEDFKGRILVVDLDLHHGDGTRRVFADDETVYTFSLHANTWDDSPAKACYDVALHSGIGDFSYLRELEAALPKVFMEARPELVFYIAGVDVAADDPLGNWRLTPEGILLRDMRVVEAAGETPMVWTLAGGYGRDAWRYTAGSLCWLFTGRKKSIPTGSQEELIRYRKIAGSLNVGELSAEPDGGGYFTTEDVFSELIGPPKQGKLLGFYTKTGVETALEKYGLLEHLRKLGFSEVDLEFDLEHPGGQLLRIRGNKRLLVEMVLRDSREHPPYRFLSIEWLLMQNPEAQPVRELLPGQNHPGLGALRNLFLMLVMVCERLNMDSIHFCPSHYHVAAQARGILAFLHPLDAAWFACVEEVVAGLPLADATRLVHGGGLVYAQGGEVVEWRPAAMVLPVSARLKEWIQSEEYQTELEKGLQQFEIRRKSL